MRTSVYRWMGNEVVSLSAQSWPEAAPAEAMQTLVRRMESELENLGLSLADTVRTRLWARDRGARDEASKERRRIFDGAARSVSSSFIAPSFFSSRSSSVAMDLLAMRPSNGGAGKLLKEYEPPIVPLRYLTIDSLVFLSGVTAVLPTLEEQVRDITTRIGASLEDAGSAWEKVVLMSCYLHSSQTIDDLTSLLRAMVPSPVLCMEFGFVDGYSEPGKLVEIETTAWGR